jgi:hypothetical protein
MKYTFIDGDKRYSRKTKNKLTINASLDDDKVKIEFINREDKPIIELQLSHNEAAALAGAVFAANSGALASILSRQPQEI